MNTLKQHRQEMQTLASKLDAYYRDDYERVLGYGSGHEDCMKHDFGEAGLQALDAAREKIVSAPSWGKLKAAALRYAHSLSRYTYATTIAGLEKEPEKALTAHAGVMNAKSTACKTLTTLANAVFAETGLPRRPRGMFRGEDGLDWKRLVEP